MLVVAASAVVASSVHFFFDFDFLVFFGHAGIYVAPGVPLSGGAMKFTAPRRASLRPRGVGSRANRCETLADPVGVNRVDLGMATLGKGKAMLLGHLCVENPVDPFSIGRVVHVAILYGDVLIVANPESPRESRFSLSFCGLVDKFIEFDTEWDFGEGIVVAIGYGSGNYW